MRIYIDDGSTHIKMLWEQHGRTFTHLSPNSFKRGWSATFGNSKPFNYTADKEKYSFDLLSPDALTTTNINWQYSPLNAVAVHHALLTSGIAPQCVDIVVTLPLTEFYDEDAQYRLDNIARKKQNLLRPVTLNNSHVFTVNRVTVRPESIPAGIALCDHLSPHHSVLIIDLGGTTLDISQVAGQMSSVSHVRGEPALGVSLVTDEVLQALRKAGMSLSRYSVEQLIIRRFDDIYLANNINDPRAVGDIKQAIHRGTARYRTRVLEAIDRFKGYTHVAYYRERRSPNNGVFQGSCRLM
ncbi:recombinase [Salmonella enterica subsp. enterica]|nr:recombinase [Salmonella enterica]EDQ2735885.1 recombinase [Salmonella enterica subsp. enterica]EDW5115491.1 recombinase [Salmonella enterica subsp. enterica serovar Irumu]EBG7962581.1 recombinase [Salmonella enterica]ECH2195379.1 recombinase [Salmonella enterica]